MAERVSGNPARLEAYTRRTKDLIGLERSSTADYSEAINAFMRAEPNSFGVSFFGLHYHAPGAKLILNRSNALKGLADRFERLDAKPAAFAFALRQLDSSGASVVSTAEIRMFQALAQARLDAPLASDVTVHKRAAEALGRTLADHIRNDLKGGTVDQALLRQLEQWAGDPDFIKSFYTKLGSEDTAALYRFLVSDYKRLAESGELSKDQIDRVNEAIQEVEDSLQRLEEVSESGSGVKIAAGGALALAGGLIADDVTIWGIFDDPGIPVALTAAVILAIVRATQSSSPEEIAEAVRVSSETMTEAVSTIGAIMLAKGLTPEEQAEGDELVRQGQEKLGRGHTDAARQRWQEWYNNLNKRQRDLYRKQGGPSARRRN